MDSVLTWIAAGFAALLLVAVLVAWLEHLQQIDGQLPAPDAARAPVAIDIPLDDLALLSAADAATRRRGLLEGALGRLSNGGSGWNDTRPMIQAGGAPHDAALAADAAIDIAAERRSAAPALQR